MVPAPETGRPAAYDHYREGGMMMAIVGYRSHRMSEVNGPDRWACYCLDCAQQEPTAEYPIDDEDPAEDERIICDGCGKVIYEGWPEE